MQGKMCSVQIAPHVHKKRAPLLNACRLCRLGINFLKIVCACPKAVISTGAAWSVSQCCPSLNFSVYFRGNAFKMAYFHVWRGKMFLVTIKEYSNYCSLKLIPCKYLVQEVQLLNSMQACNGSYIHSAGGFAIL